MVQTVASESSRTPSTLSKRLNLTREILESIEYEDVGALKILKKGPLWLVRSKVASVFQKAYKPCVATLEQVEENAEKRNLLVLSMTRPSESLELDVAVLQEARDEISKGWADGPWKLEQLESRVVQLFPEGFPWPRGKDQDDRRLLRFRGK